MMRKFWIKREEELLEKAWNSMEYSREDLVRIFHRGWRAIEIKAERIGLTPRYLLESQARIESIEKALKEDHVI